MEQRARSVAAVLLLAAGAGPGCAAGAAPPAAGPPALVQRGLVVEVGPLAPGSVTSGLRVRSRGGQERTYVLGPRTVVDTIPGQAPTLAAGDLVGVLALPTGAVTEVVVFPRGFGWRTTGAGASR